jgi:hypothetical protein
MPVHHATQGVDPAASLDAVVAKVEAKGETVVQVTEIGNDWVIVTAAPPRAPSYKTRVLTGDKTR